MFYVGEYVRCRYDFCRPLIFTDLPRHIPFKEGNECGNATLISQIAYLARFDTLHPMSRLVKIAKQGSIVRSDIDDQVVWRQKAKLLALTVKLGKIIPQNL